MPMLSELPKSDAVTHSEERLLTVRMSDKAKQTLARAAQRDENLRQQMVAARECLFARYEGMITAESQEVELEGSRRYGKILVEYGFRQLEPAKFVLDIFDFSVVDPDNPEGDDSTFFVSHRDGVTVRRKITKGEFMMILRGEFSGEELLACEGIEISDDEVLVFLNFVGALEIHFDASVTVTELMVNYGQVRVMISISALPASRSANPPRNGTLSFYGDGSVIIHDFHIATGACDLDVMFDADFTEVVLPNCYIDPTRNFLGRKLSTSEKAFSRALLVNSVDSLTNDDNFGLEAVTVDYTIEAGDPLTIVDVTGPEVTVAINPDGTITFDPNPGFERPATITYMIEDPGGLQHTAEVTVHVDDKRLLTIQPEDPNGLTDLATGNSLTAENGALAQMVITRDGNLCDLLAVMFDNGGPSMTDALAAVTISAVEIASVHYPDLDGPQFPFVKASVTSHNSADDEVPAATDDAITFSEIEGPGDTDDNFGSDVVTVNGAGNIAIMLSEGVVTIKADGPLVFDAANGDVDKLSVGESRDVTVDCTIEDGVPATTRITISVKGENDGPGAADDTATTPFDTPVTIPGKFREVGDDDRRAGDICPTKLGQLGNVGTWLRKG